MTEPSRETIEREQNKPSAEMPLYVTDGEIARRMGVGINSGRKAVQKMRLHPRFPPKAIGGKRYWPLVRDFLDFWNGRTVEGAGNSAGQEIGPGQTANRTGPHWRGLEAAERRLEESRRKREAAGLPPLEPMTASSPIQKRKLTPRIPPPAK